MYGSIGHTALSFYETEIVCPYIHIYKNQMDPRSNNVNNINENKINFKH